MILKISVDSSQFLRSVGTLQSVLNIIIYRMGINRTVFEIR